MSIPQRIHFIGKVEEDNSVTMFLSMKISKELFSSFLDSLNITESCKQWNLEKY